MTRPVSLSQLRTVQRDPLIAALPVVTWMERAGIVMTQAEIDRDAFFGDCF